MNRSHDVAGPRPRIILLLVCALAMLAAALLGPAARAGASSGGVSPNSATEEETATETKYERLWDEVSRRNRRWARKTSECESGGDPNAIGGGGKYRGAFQFLKSTWRNSPKSPGGDPIDYPYQTQAVVAVALKKHDGTGHWPNCG